MICDGGGSIGLAFALGGAALGLGVSVGGLAVGSVAVGGAAVGFMYAIGGGAIAPAVIDEGAPLAHPTCLSSSASSSPEMPPLLL